MKSILQRKVCRESSSQILLSKQENSRSKNEEKPISKVPFNQKNEVDDNIIINSLDRNDAAENKFGKIGRAHV